MAKTAVSVTFEFVGDNFASAWYFNRFRCDAMGGSVLVTTALVSATGGTPVVNGFVLSRRDLAANKERSLKYIGDLGAALGGEAEEDASLVFSASPSRIYPVNHMNLSRMDEVGEIALYRYSMHTLLNLTKEPKAKTSEKIPCYPVVVFRSSSAVQLALLKELFSADEG